MKKISFYILMFCILPLGVFAQPALSIQESTVKYKGTDYPSVEVLLQPEAKEVKKAWEDFLKKEYDVNLKGIGFLVNKDVLSAEQVRFPELSEKDMDFYTKIVEKKGTTYMNVFASLGYDIHLDPRGAYAQGFGEMRRIVSSFLTQYLPDYYQDQIKALDKEVTGLTKDRTDLEETLAGNRTRIEELKAEIKSLEKDNKDLAKDLKEKVKSLEKAQEKLTAGRRAFEEVKSQLAIPENS